MRSPIYTETKGRGEGNGAAAAIDDIATEERTSKSRYLTAQQVDY